MPSWTLRRSACLVGLPTLLVATLTLASAATQQGNCGYSLSPRTVSASASGGEYGVNVVTYPGCRWAAKTTLPWVKLSTDAGEGRGAVFFEIQANTSPSSRTGTIEVAGQAVTVSQNGGPPCSFSVSPTYISVPADGGSREVGVVVRTGCTWDVASSEEWLVPSAKGGTGSGTLWIAVEANDEIAGRTAWLTVGPATVAVSQRGKPRRLTCAATYASTLTSSCRSMPVGCGSRTLGGR